MTAKYPDLCAFEEDLDEDDRLIQATARRFVDSSVKPSIARYFEEQIFPRELVTEMGSLGLLGAMISEEYGGSAASALQYGLICRELERGDSGVRSFCSVQSSLVMYPISRYGSEEQKKKWLPKLAAGEAIGCFGLTEPDFGSNPAGMRTRAKKDGSKYVLNGVKRWITNANVADVCLVWARDDEGVVSGFLIEKDTEGLTQKEMKHKLSLCASHTGELLLENCVVSEEQRLPKASGLGSALSALDSARYGIIWGAIGAAEDCYQCALEYAQSRVQFSKPISSYQLVQAKLVGMAAEITKAQLLALRIAQQRDRGKNTFEQTSLGKMNNVRMALDIARTARDILGANGITTEYPVMRHMVNLESVITYEGTEDIHRLILGKSITGTAAFE